MARNTSGAARMGTLRIAGKTVTVAQDGAPADTNGDGLPDSWQMLYFMSANSSNAVPTLDPDGDGLSNLNEYLAGTIPTDGASALRITSVQVAGAGQALELSFPALLQRFYQVQRTADLISPQWKGFTNALFGIGAPLPLSSPIPTNTPAMFYRVLLVD